MLGVHIANFEPGRQGGGWSFARNFAKGIAPHLADYDHANIYFITSASMVKREEVQKAKKDGKKIVLRVDNILRPSRNRGGGMSHLKDYADMADLVIYQSRDAWDRLSDYLNKVGTIILNGTDPEFFYPAKERPEKITFLYSRFNRDETKNWEVARDYYAETSAAIGNACKLYIVGQFSDELREYNFDFYNNEDFQYLGVVKSPQELGDIYRSCTHLIYPYWRDACSNTLIEALMSGLKISYPDPFFKKGSANEIHTLWDIYGDTYFGLDRMASEYITAMEGL